VLSLQPAGDADPEDVKRFDDDSAALGAAFDAASTPFLPAYPGQAWPVDSTVAIASLALHDRLRPPRFGPTVARWLDAARQRLDPATGLLPHTVDVDTGAPRETARGSSQSVIQRFLVDIDPAFAAEQYPRFRERFVTSPLGLGPAVREYPVGLDGPGDVDSGPLLLGITLSATVVTMGAAQVNGDSALAAGLANYGEFAGLPIDTPWSKRYAFGVLPVGDAFLAWSKTARPWVNPTPSGTSPGTNSGSRSTSRCWLGIQAEPRPRTEEVRSGPIVVHDIPYRGRPSRIRSRGTPAFTYCSIDQRSVYSPSARSMGALAPGLEPDQW